MQTTVAITRYVEVEPAAVGRPLETAGLPVIAARNRPGTGSVPIHDVDPLIPIGVLVLVARDVRDEAAIG